MSRRDILAFVRVGDKEGRASGTAFWNGASLPQALVMTEHTRAPCLHIRRINGNTLATLIHLACSGALARRGAP